MKRGLVAGLVAGTLFAASGAIAAAQCPDAKGILHKVFGEQEEKIEVLEQTKVTNGLCAAFVKGSGSFIPRMFTYTEDGEYVIFGTVINTSNSSIWGDEILRKYSVLDKNIMSKMHNTAVIVGKSPKTFYIAVSPTCPHCKNAIEDLKPEIDKGELSLGVMLVALSEKDRALIEHVLCSKEDLLAAYLKSSGLPEGGLLKCEAGKKKASDMAVLMQEIGITAAPTLISKDGRVIMGYPGKGTAMGAMTANQ